jgi:hypothetical protein
VNARGQHYLARPVDGNYFGAETCFQRGEFSQWLIQFAMGAGRTVTLDQLVDSQEIGLDTQILLGRGVCDDQRYTPCISTARGFNDGHVALFP